MYIKNFSELKNDYYKLHRAECIARTKIYYQNHRQKLSNYNSQYYLKNKDFLAFYNYMRNRELKRRSVSINLPIKYVLGDNQQDFIFSFDR